MGYSRSSALKDAPGQTGSTGAAARTSPRLDQFRRQGRGPGVDLVADIREGLPLASGTHRLCGQRPCPARVRLRGARSPVLEELCAGAQAGRSPAARASRSCRRHRRLHARRQRLLPGRRRGGRVPGRPLHRSHALVRLLAQPVHRRTSPPSCLKRSGFIEVRQCPVWTPRESEFRQIVDLDNRPEESFFIEAGDPRPAGRPARSLQSPAWRTSLACRIVR